MIMICNRIMIFPSSLFICFTYGSISFFVQSALLCIIIIICYRRYHRCHRYHRYRFAIIAIELLSSLSEYYLVPSMHPCII